MSEQDRPEWAPLPAGLSREASLLAEQLRLLKERTGLSLAALADRTHYSKSSWQRCLNGRQIPPRSALKALAEAAGADPSRLLSLREAVLRAVPAPTPAPETPGAAAPETLSEPAAPTKRHWRLLTAVLLAVLLTATGTYVTVTQLVNQDGAGCTTLETDP
ncbi:helix-turn-helix domain protein [Actinobacteria bacterium OK074]|nr:helix-turn-helix domain protein [Actinobacteria bacterium OK074]